MAVAARFPRAICLAGAAAALLLLALAGGAQAAELLNVRLGYHADKTRVVFDLDTAASYRIASQSNSELVLEFDARASDEAIPGNGKPLRWVTIQGEGAGRSRVRMTLAGPVKLNAQVLRRPDRVVLDLLPPTAAAPARKPAPKPEPAPPPAPPPEPEFATAEVEEIPLAPPPVFDDTEPSFGGTGLLQVAMWTLLAALAVGTGLALRRRRAAAQIAEDDGWGPPVASAPAAATPAAAAAPRRPAPVPPIAAAPAANPGLDESNERRIARLEKRMEAMLDSRERLEIQLAKQAEEQRVLRAALASIQHKLRERGRSGGDSKDGGKD